MSESAKPQPVFKFAQPPVEPTTEYDVIAAYEMFLGRNPESEAVIHDKIAQGTHRMIPGLMRSNEFNEKVALPLQANRPVKRADHYRKPAEDELSWLFGWIEFDAAAQTELRAAADWSDFFRRLLQHGDTDPPEAPTAEAPPAVEIDEYAAAPPMTEVAKLQLVFNFIQPPVEPTTERDVIAAYQMFLGRKPESEAVINDNIAQGGHRMIPGLLRSNEFHEKVVHPLQANRQVKRADYYRRPAEDELSWLFGWIEFNAAAQTELRAAADWSDFFRRLLQHGGADLPEAPSAAPPPAGDIDTLLRRLDEFRGLLTEIETTLRANKR